MSDSLRRISVHSVDGNHRGTIDLALPSAMTIAELLPSIIDRVGASGPDAPIRWRLCRLAGAALDQSMSLSEVGVRDGEVLLLSRHEPPPPAFRSQDLSTVVADAAAGGPSSRLITSAATAWTVAAGAVAVTCAGVSSSTAIHLGIVGALATAAAAAAVVADRTGSDPWWRRSLQHVALLLAAVLGYRIVPGGPAPANFLLAASSVTVASILLLRLSVRPSVWLTAVAVSGSLMAAALGAAMVWAAPTAVIGTILTALGLVTLSSAARLSVLLAGLVPAGQTLVVEGVADQRAARGRWLLASLVTGASGAALAGVLLVAVGGAGVGAPWPVDAGFCGAVGLALLLRSRSHADGWCRTALTVCGMGCLTAAFAGVSVAMTSQAFWIAVSTVVAGSVALSPAARSAAGPVAARAVDALEYIALTTVVPLACWIAGVFAAVRGWQLP
ncbi:type VII secretion integral membrane protein EccD [Mycobacterium sp. CPCC 205372]|uniref:Type VII secretion integral membrane protein EccD n=1 Tax=Mycobacterium hippophais TaxID=3016340 RepID=A0ABT4PR76_9MYCO|nr:type VII secretion integral membrane protein EccD [Mycobacterium hippophais]MCZ8379053.1 type VII secretion integral membrane protein EccD [Mycobacterium hippophais]